MESEKSAVISTTSGGIMQTTTAVSTTSGGPGITEQSGKRCAVKWSRGVLALQEPIRRGLTRIALHSARHASLYITFIVAASLSLITAGYYTNFVFENNESNLWSPTGSLPDIHSRWIEQQFVRMGQDEYAPETDNTDLKVGQGFIALIVHAEGANIASKQGLTKTFEAVDRVRGVSGFDEYCAMHGSPPCPLEVPDLVCLAYQVPTDSDSPRVCNDIAGVTGLWFHNVTIFEQKVQTDEDAQRSLGIQFLPGQDEPFDPTNFVGFPEYQDDEGNSKNKRRLVSAKSFFTGIRLPYPKEALGDVNKITASMRDEMLLLQQEWKDDPDNMYRVELLIKNSFEQELLRGIQQDLPIIPFAMILMSGFTALVFFKCDWLHSQCLLGVGAVACVTLSLLTGFGIMFLVGMPFTTMTLTLVCVLYGVGLDDSFIISSSFLRTNQSKSTTERICDTMDDVAISIFMTTATTQVGFALGCLSQIPVIRWLCVCINRFFIYYLLL